MIALAALAVASWLGHHRRLFALCLLWLPLVREDGGFYTAVACLACLAVEWDPARPRDSSARLLVVLSLAGILASACSLVPNEIRPDEVLTTDTDFRTCQIVALMRGEMQYRELATRGKAAGFRRMASRDNAEVWVGVNERYTGKK